MVREPHPESVEWGDETWERLNQRRIDLIHRKNRGGLTDVEAAEFERLQEIVSSALERAFPRTPFDWERLNRTRSRLEAEEK